MIWAVPEWTVGQAAQQTILRGDYAILRARHELVRTWQQQDPMRYVRVDRALCMASYDWKQPVVIKGLRVVGQVAHNIWIRGAERWVPWTWARNYELVVDKLDVMVELTARQSGIKAVRIQFQPIEGRNDVPDTVSVRAGNVPDVSNMHWWRGTLQGKTLELKDTSPDRTISATDVFGGHMLGDTSPRDVVVDGTNHVFGGPVVGDVAGYISPSWIPSGTVIVPGAGPVSAVMVGEEDGWWNSAVVRREFLDWETTRLMGRMRGEIVVECDVDFGVTVAIEIDGQESGSSRTVVASTRKDGRGKGIRHTVPFNWVLDWTGDAPRVPELVVRLHVNDRGNMSHGPCKWDVTIEEPICVESQTYPIAYAIDDGAVVRIVVQDPPVWTIGAFYRPNDEVTNGIVMSFKLTSGYVHHIQSTDVGHANQLLVTVETDEKVGHQDRTITFRTDDGIVCEQSLQWANNATIEHVYIGGAYNGSVSDSVFGSGSALSDVNVWYRKLDNDDIDQIWAKKSDASLSMTDETFRSGRRTVETMTPTGVTIDGDVTEVPLEDGGGWISNIAQDIVWGPIGNGQPLRGKSIVVDGDPVEEMWVCPMVGTDAPTDWIKVERNQLADEDGMYLQVNDEWPDAWWVKCKVATGARIRMISIDADVVDSTVENSLFETTEILISEHHRGMLNLKTDAKDGSVMKAVIDAEGRYSENYLKVSWQDDTPNARFLFQATDNPEVLTSTRTSIDFTLGTQYEFREEKNDGDELILVSRNELLWRSVNLLQDGEGLVEVAIEHPDEIFNWRALPKSPIFAGIGKLWIRVTGADDSYGRLGIVHFITESIVGLDEGELTEYEPEDAKFATTVVYVPEIIGVNELTVPTPSQFDVYMRIMRLGEWFEYKGFEHTNWCPVFTSLGITTRPPPPKELQVTRMNKPVFLVRDHNFVPVGEQEYGHFVQYSDLILVDFKWQFSGDDVQQGYHIQIAPYYGTVLPPSHWGTPMWQDTQASPDSYAEYSMDAPVLERGGEYQWHVRVRGEELIEWSRWSVTQVFSINELPTFPYDLNAFDG